MRYLYFILTILAATACKKKATIRLPASAEKLVVCCFLSPNDSVITVSVRTSEPRYETTGHPKEVDDATVRISGKGRNITLPYYFGHYQADAREFPVLPGESYTLEVSAAGYDPVYAVTSVPADTIPIVSPAIEIIREDSTDLLFRYSFEAIDIPGQTNYVALFHRVVHSFMGTFHDLQLFQNWDAEFVDDVFREHRSYKRRSEEERTHPSSRSDTWVFIDVLHCSRDFYLYNRSLQQAGTSGGNPFADPVLIHNNINGGFGCFGAYYRTRRIMSLQ